MRAKARRRDKNLVITYSTKRRRKNISKSAGEIVPKKKIEKMKAQPASTPPPVCHFCLSSEDNEVDLGPIHEKNGVTVHYYCMLLSSGLKQTARPSDKRSILGFTKEDIDKELKRGKRLKCCFCHKKGATIGCSVSHCKKAFHLCCGRKNGTMHHFFDTFRSFCAEHWSHPCLDSPLKRGISRICSICQMAMGNNTANEIVCPPCCKRTYFHHSCMQRYALSAGMHFFKCPLCNANTDFQKAMLLCGIYLPDRDASWEKEPNAFQELLERPEKCDVTPCICPHGEKYSASSGNFKLLICHYCGSYCAHKRCAGLSTKMLYLTCPDCGGT